LKEGVDYHVSSSNVFADLGHPEPDEALVKAKLAYVISTIILDKGWSQTQAADVLGVDQPKISALLNGRLRGFSTERLIRFLNALDQDVEIAVRPKDHQKHQATIEVTSPLIPVGAVNASEGR